ncbi:MAG: hypothetical protein U0136_13355 [Bdellovibrionota bacterium]
MANLILRLSGQQLALNEVMFSHPLLDSPRVSKRGKGLFPGICESSFQWTSGVQALTVLCLRTKAAQAASARSSEPPTATSIRGGSGSLAASLDYALSKRPLWLLDMFGVDSYGECLSKRIFVRWNPERKRGDEVLVALNPKQLPICGLKIELGPLLLDSADLCLTLADRIEAAFSTNAHSTVRHGMRNSRSCFSDQSR